MKALGRLRHQPTIPQPTGDNDESPLGIFAFRFSLLILKGSILNEMSKMNLKFGRLKVKPLHFRRRLLF